MRTVRLAARVKRPPSTKEKLDALKNGVELPVDPATLYIIAEPGPDERSVCILARVYQKEEDPDYVSVSWACQVKAAAFFNEHGLNATLKEILRIDPNALESA